MNEWLGEHLGSRVLASEARGSRSDSAELVVRARLKALLPALSAVCAVPGRFLSALSQPCDCPVRNSVPCTGSVLSSL
jgi:hypothetical protein